MVFGERLKLVRGSMPQDDFAKIMGVHKNTIGRFERGEGQPNVDELNKILAAFPDINPAWLLTGEEPIRRGVIESTHQPSGPLDEQLLIGVIEGVDEYLDQVKGRLTPAKKAQLIATLYEMCADEKKVLDKATVIRLVKLAA